MTINADTLLDRLHLKTQIRKWQIFTVLLAVVALVVAVERNARHSPIEREFVARIAIEGFIDDNQELYDLIDDVAANPRAKAVIVWLDTPGGSAVGGEEIYLHLRKLGEQKPVVAVMRSVSASAGYMIALGADHIVAREGTITGSIGVLLETAEITELAKKLGVTPLTVKSAPLKGSPSLFEKSTPEAERALQEVIDDFYAHFVDMVAERRKLPRERALALSDGRVYSGKRALNLKLIDALGGEDEAMEWLIANRKISKDIPIKDMELKPELSFFEQMTQSAMGKFMGRSSLGLDGLAAVWHPQLH